MMGRGWQGNEIGYGEDWDQGHHGRGRSAFETSQTEGGPRRCLRENMRIKFAALGWS
jgi:hypothetical protein